MGHKGIEKEESMNGLCTLGRIRTRDVPTRKRTPVPSGRGHGEDSGSLEPGVEGRNRTGDHSVCSGSPCHLGTSTLEQVRGIEPPPRGWQPRARPSSCTCMERMDGIEPTFSGWKPDTLPLSYTRVYKTSSKTSSWRGESDPSPPLYQRGAPPWSYASEFDDNHRWSLPESNRHLLLAEQSLSLRAKAPHSMRWSRGGFQPLSQCSQHSIFPLDDDPVGNICGAVEDRTRISDVRSRCLPNWTIAPIAIHQMKQLLLGCSYLAELLRFELSKPITEERRPSESHK